jgi:hypothetical protein
MSRRRRHRIVTSNEMSLRFRFAGLLRIVPSAIRRLSTYQESQMTFRLACASTFTAIGLACSSAACARGIVYLPVTVIYAPPPRPAFYPEPINPMYVSAPRHAVDSA